MKTSVSKILRLIAFPREDYTALVREAGKQTAATGKRVSVAALIRSAVSVWLDGCEKKS